MEGSLGRKVRERDHCELRRVQEVSVDEVAFELLWKEGLRKI